MRIPKAFVACTLLRGLLRAVAWTPMRGLLLLLYSCFTHMAYTACSLLLELLCVVAWTPMRGLLLIPLLMLPCPPKFEKSTKNRKSPGTSGSLWEASGGLRGPSGAPESPRKPSKTAENLRKPSTRSRRKLPLLMLPCPGPEDRRGGREAPAASRPGPGSRREAPPRSKGQSSLHGC